jgi:hypothetical protein
VPRARKRTAEALGPAAVEIALAEWRLFESLREIRIEGCDQRRVHDVGDDNVTLLEHAFGPEFDLRL